MLRVARQSAIVAALLTTACAAPVVAQMLNSERIEQTFGSYGIDVIYSDETLRISSLYSEQDGQKVTRTLAFVEYPEIIDPAYEAEHQTILDGGSIGSTFTAAGWEVAKQNLSIIALAAEQEFADSLGVESGAQLATHLYRLDIVRDERQFPYALIAEMHHPAYLNRVDLINIYPLVLEPPTEDSFESIPQREAVLRRHMQLLHAGQQMLRELESALSQ